MTNKNIDNSAASLQNEYSSYLDHKLNVFRKHINILILAAGLINLLLIIPDLSLIENTSSKTSITIVRTVYSLILFIVSYRIKSLKSFEPFSIVISICEIAGMAIFLFVFCQYPQPNFLIQAMGLITLFLIIFLVPNRWINMVFIAVTGAIGFFLCALFFINSTEMTDFWAALVYVAIAILLCSIAARNSEQHQFSEYKTKKALVRLSTTDFLTNTANRFKIKEDAERWIIFCHRQGLPLSLVFFDVDDMKTINDQYGHATGDFVLTSLTNLVQSQLRSSDILARWGGDEFVLLLPSVDMDNAIALSERIEKHIKEHDFIEGYVITCSLGVVEMKENSDFESLVREADELMYARKKQRKSCVC